LVFAEKKEPAIHDLSIPIQAGSGTMTNLNLARGDDLATVRQARESLVREGPELTLVIPTLNERDNIGPLVDLLDEVLDRVNWEVIFVDDDSPDGTA
jgi:hypothetical protein